MSGNDEVRGLIERARNPIRHGDDADHCPACFGSCGAWPGERAGGDEEEIIAALAVALEASLTPEPAGDERERLVAILNATCTPKRIIEWSEFADAILAAGFRSHPAPAATLQEVSKALAIAFTLPKLEIEMPVNMCPDDDPVGERPMKKTWATDITAIATALTAQFDMRRRDT